MEPIIYSRNETVREAIRTARDEAKIMAEPLRMTLGLPLEVHGEVDVPILQRFLQSGAERACAVADATPALIEVGVQTILAWETIRFRPNPTP